MTSLHYQYTPLSSESSFRLIRLKPTSNSRTTTGTADLELFEVPFDGAPAFEAASYAWNHADTHVTLNCNGRQLQVPSVVQQMISTLNRISDTGIFWIDALCIDQSSPSDKNIQVPRMRDIYSEASRVWIWLGEGSSESTSALRLLFDLNANLPNSAMGLVDGWQSIFQAHQDMVRKVRGVYDAVDTEFIVDIVRSPWFTRTWTVQEVALAEHATLVYGDITLDWDAFLATLHALQNAVNNIAAGKTESSRGMISNPATFFDDIRTHDIMTAIVRSGDYLTMAFAFDLLRQNHSSDPKDKVYGIFGILDYLEVRDLPSVDYTSPVQQVYHDVTRTILLNDESLDILNMIGLQPKVSGLPTWVPDFSNTDFVRYFDVWRYKASGQSPADFTYGLSDLLLSVSVVLLDQINLQATSTSVCTADFRKGFAARSNLSSIEERHTAVTELIRTLRSWIKTSQTLTSYPTGEEPSEAFYRILTQPLCPGSQSWPGSSSFKATRDVFERWLSFLTADLSKDPTRLYVDIANIENDSIAAAIILDYIQLFGCSPDPRTWSDELQLRLVLRASEQSLSKLQHDISLLSYQRTFFTTTEGYMGVGPRLAKPTDRIALIAGLQLPFIVRKTGDNYNLIGPAYIHGIMQGERWDRALAEKITLV